MKRVLFKSAILTAVCASLCAGFGLTSCAGTADVRDDLTVACETPLKISATDALGRVVEPSDGYLEDKYVGMFYFVWLGTSPLNKYDINWLLENHPEAIYQKDSPYSRLGFAHFWGEPLYGYYDMSDEWVITRHVEMLTDAGIDFIGLDLTNNKTYDDNVQILLDVLLKFQEQGFKVPQVMALTNTNAEGVAVHLYEKWYTDEKYSSLWFAPNGKPMISCTTASWDSPKRTPEENAYYAKVKETFDVKYHQWPIEGHDYPDGFPWIEFTYPQPLHEQSGVMSVSTSQHTPSVRMSWMGKGNRGRSFNFETGKNEDERFAEGINYQSQWNTALTTDGVRIVFVTGWNEWQAGKFWNPRDNFGKSEAFFVDQFSTNYSRDIEPMKGGYNDNYYLQTIKNVRAFKSSGSTPQTVARHTIDIDGALSQWDKVTEVYRDYEGDAIPRDCKGSIEGYWYSDSSNRNDIVTVKVATDSDYAWFYVQTASDITPYEGGTNWMNIMIFGGEGGFEGYTRIINAAPQGTSTSVDAFTGNGFELSPVGTADLRVSGSVMQVRVALSDIGVDPADPHFSFKVCDNVTHQDDIMDYYVSGDCAPIGRLNYTYGY